MLQLKLNTTIKQIEVIIAEYYIIHIKMINIHFYFFLALLIIYIISAFLLCIFYFIYYKYTISGRRIYKIRIQKNLSESMFYPLEIDKKIIVVGKYHEYSSKIMFYLLDSLCNWPLYHITNLIFNYLYILILSLYLIYLFILKNKLNIILFSFFFFSIFYILSTFLTIKIILFFYFIFIILFIRNIFHYCINNFFTNDTPVDINYFLINNINELYN